jgi:hypothetical protein
MGELGFHTLVGEVTPTHDPERLSKGLARQPVPPQLQRALPGAQGFRPPA